MIAVAQGGAIYPLVELLETSSLTCCEAVAWALKNIACHEENALKICNVHGIQALVKTLNSQVAELEKEESQKPSNYWRLIESLVSALGALTTCNETKTLVGQLGLVRSAIQFIRDETPERYYSLSLL